MPQMRTSIVQIPPEWAETNPERQSEIEQCGHHCMYGDDPHMADFTMVDEDDWEFFLLEMEHPIDFRQYVS